MKKSHQILPLLFLTFAFSYPLHGATIWDLNNNSSFDSLDSNWKAGQSANVSLYTDTNDYFKTGTDTNSVLRIADNSTAYIRYAYFPITSPTELITISYDAVITDQSADISFLASLKTSTANPTGASRIATVAMNGASNSLYRVMFYFNGTGSDATYYDPIDDISKTLASGQSTGFFYGTENQAWLSASAGSTNTGGPSAITQFALHVGHSASNTGTILIDNLSVADGLTMIPEPSSYSIGAVGILGVLLLGRRRSRL